MILQTQIPIQKQKEHTIDYNSKVLLLGSCFSENIGNKLAYYKFQSSQNPYGILFHPRAIEQLIENTISKKEFTENDVFYHNEQWHCFETHSLLSNSNQEELLENLNKTTKETFHKIKEVTHLIITLGTAWTYKQISSNKTVANCHKVSQKEFSKELLIVDEITASLHNIASAIKTVNKDITILFTVSPVRHIKDGFTENKRSKSHLISGIHQFLDTKSTNTFYFPSYEIMMDELRDYRFYNEDMIHPNKTAINYIWERFSNTWFSDESLKTMRRVEEIQRGLSHRPFNPDSEAHLKFLKNLTKKKETLLQMFPFIQF